MKVAVLGTGTMGSGMARSLQRAGLEVSAWNRTAEKAAPLGRDGITVAESVAAAVNDTQIVLTMLFDADSVLAIADELVRAMPTDAVWIQSSTVGPDGIRAIAEAVPEGVALLDAPVLGTKQPAADGKLVALVSGPADVLERARPALDAISARTVVAGSRLGDASALKLACNAWVLSITAATAQSLVLAESLDVDGAQFLEAIGGGPTDSPYAQLKGKAMLAGDFTPSFELDGGRKDLGLIIDAARSVHVRTPMLAGTAELYDRASREGHGSHDLAAVFTALADGDDDD